MEENNNRFFTVKEIENTFSITNQTARSDIEDLVERGFLKKVAVNKKASNYWKGDKFDAEFLWDSETSSEWQIIVLSKDPRILY